MSCNLEKTHLANQEVEINKLEDSNVLFSDYCLSTRADFSNTEIRDLPDTNRLSAFIESLNLSHNLITNLSYHIREYRLLTHLDLNHNKICSLPSSLCELPFIKSLNLSHNLLSTVPQEIKNLCSLEELVSQNFYLYFQNIGFNKIHLLPIQICELSNLKVLSIPNNLIDCLPTEICQLKRLRVLDVRTNHLCTLPSSLSLLEDLEYLFLDDNPLICPSLKIVVRGLPHVMAYLKHEMYLNQNTISNQNQLLLDNAKQLIKQKSISLNSLPQSETVFNLIRSDQSISDNYPDSIKTQKLEKPTEPNTNDSPLESQNFITNEEFPIQNTNDLKNPHLTDTTNFRTMENIESGNHEFELVNTGSGATSMSTDPELLLLHSNTDQNLFSNLNMIRGENSMSSSNQSINRILISKNNNNNNNDIKIKNSKNEIVSPKLKQFREKKSSNIPNWIQTEYFDSHSSVRARNRSLSQNNRSFDECTSFVDHGMNENSLTTTNPDNKLPKYERIGRVYSNSARLRCSKRINCKRNYVGRHSINHHHPPGNSIANQHTDTKLFTSEPVSHIQFDPRLYKAANLPSSLSETETNYLPSRNRSQPRNYSELDSSRVGVALFLPSERILKSPQPIRHPTFDFNPSNSSKSNSKLFSNSSDFTYLNISTDWKKLSPSEAKIIHQLKRIMEMQLNIALPTEPHHLAIELSTGILLIHLLNKLIGPTSNLKPCMPKCDNFNPEFQIEASRLYRRNFKRCKEWMYRLGVPREYLFSTEKLLNPEHPTGLICLANSVLLLYNICYPNKICTSQPPNKFRSQTPNESIISSSPTLRHTSNRLNQARINQFSSWPHHLCSDV